MPSRGAASVFLCASALLCGTPAAAQLPVPAPPGPYVVDVRGATSGLPSAAGFYPTLPQDTSVPARGFGFEAGAHVYPLRLGPSRLGIGAAFTQVRGAVAGVSSRVRLLAPQISFNFGRAAGWSYVSAGLGAARVRTEGSGITTTGSSNEATTTLVETMEPRSRESGTLRAVNLGGGARWFLSRHIGVGFDLRFHRIAAGKASAASAGTGSTTLVAASVGFSIK